MLVDYALAVDVSVQRGKPDILHRAPQTARVHESRILEILTRPIVPRPGCLAQHWSEQNSSGQTAL